MSKARSNSLGQLGDISETSMNGGQLAGLRNKIINGAMFYDHYNSGSAVTPGITSGAGAYIVDRWCCALSVASKLTFQQVADAPVGFKFSEKITVAAQYAPGTAEFFQYRHGIEGQNIIDLGLGTAAPATIAVSLWLKGSVAGTYSVSIRNGAFDRCYVGTVAVTSAWARYTVTLVADTTGTWATDINAGLWLTIDLGSGTSFNAAATGAWGAGFLTRTSGSVTFVNQVNGSTLNITGVQLEVASPVSPVASSFEHRSMLEGVLCRRFVKPVPRCGGQASSTTLALHWYDTSDMRGPVSLSTTTGWLNSTSAGGTSSSTPGLNTPVNGDTCITSITSGLVAGNATGLIPPAGALFICEL